MNLYNQQNNIYPLKSTTHYLQLTTVPASEVLGLSFVDGAGNHIEKIGNYSVDQNIWFERNEALILTDEQLAEILASAKAYALARATRFSKLNTLANSDIYRK